jgi:hypothetical protein
MAPPPSRPPARAARPRSAGGARGAGRGARGAGRGARGVGRDQLVLLLVVELHPLEEPLDLLRGCDTYVHSLVSRLLLCVSTACVTDPADWLSHLPAVDRVLGLDVVHFGLRRGARAAQRRPRGGGRLAGGALARRGCAWGVLNLVAPRGRDSVNERPLRRAGRVRLVREEGRGVSCQYGSCGARERQRLSARLAAPGQAALALDGGLSRSADLV